MSCLQRSQPTARDAALSVPPLAAVTIARANTHVTYPARVQLVAAMNPCRCGHLGDAGLACTRAPHCATSYQARISGPLFDRIDLHVDVPPVDARDLSLPSPAEGSAEVAAHVAAARAVQRARYRGHVNGRPVRNNADADGELLMKVASPDAAGSQLLSDAVDAMKLSARAYHRVLRVARILADLASEETVDRPHVAEALSYRRLPVR